MQEKAAIEFDIITLGAERESTLRGSLHERRVLCHHHDPLRSGDGAEQHHLAQTLPDDRDNRDRVIPLLMIWKSHQNGWVYDPQGLCPCLTVGNHSGVEPKIVEWM